MIQKIFVDRSRYELAQRCQRARFLGYHFGGMGIQSACTPLPLAVGGSVHEGLAVLLRSGQHAVDTFGGVRLIQRDMWRNIEEQGVKAALGDFAQYKKAIDLDITETGAGAPTPPVMSEIDDYLYAEQSALVEALVRAYARRRLIPLLEQFEVLEVEQEGEWLLSPEWTAHKNDVPWGCGNDDDGCPKYELWFMSRPDALLRERESNQLYLQSYKTTGSWDIRKARDAEHDMQGLSEGIEIERRLAKWWEEHQTYGPDHEAWARASNTTIAMSRYLAALDAPPRIFAVRMEYLLKGERWRDKDLTLEFGVEMRSQKSHLIRRYEAVSVPMRGSAGYNIGDSCWSWDYVREDGKESSLAWQNWKSRPVWTSPAGVRDWIDKLDDAAPTMSADDPAMGLEPRLLGYKCDAQVVGVTKEHPLDVVFVPPIVVYRQEDELRDMVEQMEAQERRIAEGVAQVNAADNDGDARHALNVNFPQTRRACSYPTQCQFVPICFGGEDIRRDPVGSGLYKIRVANHPQEKSNG